MESRISTNLKPSQHQKLETQRKASPLTTSHFPESSASSPELDPSVNRSSDYSSFYKWVIPYFSKVKTKSLFSPYFLVAGIEFRLRMYPRGDSTSAPGCVALYLEINKSQSLKFNSYASFKLTLVNQVEESKSLKRQTYYRFSLRKSSFGWNHFASSSMVLQQKSGFLVDSSLVVIADVRVLDDTLTISTDNNAEESNSSRLPSDVYVGKVSWEIRNYSLFKETFKTLKILSSSFKIGVADYRVCLYHSVVNEVVFLSLFLESDIMKNVTDNGFSSVSEISSSDMRRHVLIDRSCWGLFGISILNQKPGHDHMHRKSCARFDVWGEDDVFLGWVEYMKMKDFAGSEKGFLVNGDTAMISISFQLVKESYFFKRNVGNSRLFEEKHTRAFSKFDKEDITSTFSRYDKEALKFYWDIHNLTWLKGIMKKKKLTGVCIQSRKMIRHDQYFRMVVYPRGQSHNPSYLSLFLELVTSQMASLEWNGLVYYRFGIVNLKTLAKSIIKGSLWRCCSDTKDLGCDFIPLADFFDHNSGYIMNDTASFYAEIYILKEKYTVEDLTESWNNEPSHMETRVAFKWKVENFLASKEIAATQKIYSRFFTVLNCELRFGVSVSVDSASVFLDPDPSHSSDPDNNFWVSFRIALVNQKDPTKSLWKKSALCTNICNCYDLHIMKLSDILEPNAGYVVENMVIFACEVLDYSPWFDFSEVEVLAHDDDKAASLSDRHKPLYFKDCELSVERKVDIFIDLISRAACRLMKENNHPRPLVILRKKLHLNVYTLAAILLRLRFHLDLDKIKLLLHTSKFSGVGEHKDISDESIPSSEHIMSVMKFLQQMIDDILLDIMLECCQFTKQRSSWDFCDASSVASMATSEAASQLELQRDIGQVGFVLSIIFGELGLDKGIQCTLLNIDTTMQTILGRLVSQLGTLAQCSLGIKSAAASKAMMEPSDKLLGLMVNLLKPLSGSVSLVCPWPHDGPQLAEKISLILDNAHTGMEPDLVALLYKLVNPLEHPLEACKILDQLEKPDAEPALQPSLFAAINQSRLGNKLLEHVLSQNLAHLMVSTDETLDSIIRLLFRTASQCHRIPQAVTAVCSRLEELGTAVPTCVLDLLGEIIVSWDEIAEAMLREIYSVFQLDGHQQLSADNQFSNICMLIDLYSVPALAVEATKVFEKGVAHGFIVDHLVAKVLESRFVQKLKLDALYSADSNLHKKLEDVDFLILLRLAEALSITDNPQVHEFVRRFYAILFKLFTGENHRVKLLKGLVDHAITPADNCQNNLDILIFLVNGDYEVAKRVLSMMREATMLANADRTAIWHQLSAMKDENIRKAEDCQAEISSLNEEKAILLERLSVSIRQYKSEMRRELDQIAKEKKKFSEDIEKVVHELELFRSERDDINTMLSMEKKSFQDSLRSAEIQLAGLKRQKCEAMKLVVEEKNILVEKLRNVQAERKCLDDKVKQCTLEAVIKERWSKSLLDEIWRLQQEVHNSERDRQKKDEEVAYYKAYANEMEEKLTACQQRLCFLEASLQEERSQHAPLFGVGLEDLSRRNFTLQNQMGRPRGNFVSSSLPQDYNRKQP